MFGYHLSWSKAIIDDDTGNKGGLFFFKDGRFGNHLSWSKAIIDDDTGNKGELTIKEIVRLCVPSNQA